MPKLLRDYFREVASALATPGSRGKAILPFGATEKLFRVDLLQWPAKRIPFNFFWNL